MLAAALTSATSLPLAGGVGGGALAATNAGMTPHPRSLRESPFRQAGGEALPRAASLDLCSDELALLLAAPGQLVSVSKLGADPRETALAPRAGGIHRNAGHIDGIAALAPAVVLVSGGIGGVYGAELARRLGARVVTLPYPRSITGVRANIRAAAAALGQRARGEAVIARFDATLGAVPPQLAPALLVGGGGVTPDGLAAELLRHAGLRQVTGGETVRLEALLAAPPEVLILSRYHPGEGSLNAAWLRHPALARLPVSMRRLATDGRAWTCMGPLVADEVARLRAAARRAAARP